MSTTIVATNIKNEGRSVYIKSNPTVGLLALTSFADDANSPGGGAQFIKTFRYTTNGVQYSDWLPLTVPAITSIKVDPLQPFVIEVAYQKDEPVGNSVLTVTEATIGASNQAPQLTPFFDNSLFKQYFDATDQNVLNWYVNVLEKLWAQGLIPEYMTRDPLDPDEFLALWSAVTQFFAYYVTFARTFATFYNNYDILSDFLTERGLTVSPEDTLGQLQTMLQTFYFQMAKRGTDNITAESDGSDASVTGEMRRAVHYKTTDEFLFLLFRPENFGWCLGRSSPLYKGLRVNDGLNKAPWSKGYTDMTAVTPFLTTGGSVVTDGGNKVASLSSSAIQVASGIKIDPAMDYEISFQVKLDADSTLTLEATGHTITGATVNLKSYKTGSTENSFFEEALLSRTDKYLTVRVYLYNSTRTPFAGDSTNIRQGQNLMSVATLQNIGLTLFADGTAKVYDFKIMPVQTDYSRGFLQANHFISAWVRNRNNVFSTIQLEDYVNTYLVPYNSHVKIKNIGDFIYTAMEEDPDTSFWVGAGEYCRQIVWVGTDPSCELINLVWVPEEETSFCEQV